MNYVKLFYFIVFTYLLFLFISRPCSSLEHDGATCFPTIKHRDEKVDLALYYETLCPGCAGFISQDLGKLFQKGLIDIVNLRLVPWGNAEIVEPNNTIVCQHGEDECYFNTIEACAIEAWPNPKKHFNFIHCLENQNLVEKLVDREKAWQACCQKLNLSQKPIQKCYSSGHGKKLALKYGNETIHLKPPHDFVPWVTVNRKPLSEDYLKFVSYICKAYKGPHVPEACKSLPLPAKKKDAGNAISSTSVCYADEEEI